MKSIATVRLPFLVAGLSTITFQITDFTLNLWGTVCNWTIWLICLFWAGWLVTSKDKDSVFKAALAGLLFLFAWQFVFAGTFAGIVYCFDPAADESFKILTRFDIIVLVYLTFFIAFVTAVPIGMIVSCVGGYLGKKYRLSNGGDS